MKPLSLGDLKMRSYPRQETVKFRNNASEEVVRRLGVSVLDPSPVSGPLLAVAAAPKGRHQAALHLLDLPRPAFLDSSLTDGHGGRYSFFTADPFLVLRSRGRRVELIGPAGRAVTEEDRSLGPSSTRAAPLPGGSGGSPATVSGRSRWLFRLRSRPHAGTAARYRRR